MGTAKSVSEKHKKTYVVHVLNPQGKEYKVRVRAHSAAKAKAAIRDPATAFEAYLES